MKLLYRSPEDRGCVGDVRLIIESSLRKSSEIGKFKKNFWRRYLSSVVKYLRALRRLRLPYSRLPMLLHQPFLLCCLIKRLQNRSLAQRMMAEKILRKLAILLQSYCQIYHISINRMRKNKLKKENLSYFVSDKFFPFLVIRKTMYLHLIDERTGEIAQDSESGKNGKPKYPLKSSLRPIS